MPILNPGEILKPSPQIAPATPEQARLLGNELLAAIDTYEQQTETNLPGYRIRLLSENDKQIRSHHMRLDGAAGQILDGAGAAYLDALNHNEHISFDRIEHWLIFGRHGVIIDWHTDTPGDIRFLFNLGDEPTHADIATEWDAKKYQSGEPKGIEPASFEPLSLDPAEMYVSNALVVDTELLKPHRTAAERGRLVLRSSVYAAGKWQEAAVNGGIAIQLPTAA